MKVTNTKIRDMFVSALALMVLSFGFLTFTSIGSAAPTISITSPTAGQVLSSGSFNVIGTATANSLVQVYNGNQLLGASSVDGSGNWSVAVSGLSAGSVTLSAKNIDNNQYAYFPSTNFVNSFFSRLTINEGATADTLNEGGAPWPVDTDAAGGFISGAGCVPNGTHCILFSGLDATAVPYIVDISSPGVPVAVSGYESPNPGVSTGTFSPTDGKTFYGVNYNTDNISVVDLVANSETTFDGVVDDPQAAAVSNDGTILYVSHVGPTSATTNDIAVLNASTGAKLKSDIPVGCDTAESAGTIITVGEYLYIACALDLEVKKIDSNSGAVVATYDLTGDRTKIGAVQATPDGKKLYVSGVYGTDVGANATTISVIDLETGSTSTISGLTAAYLAGIVSPDGKYVYVGTPGGFDTSNVDVISTATDTIIENIDISSVGLAGVVFFGPQSSATTTVAITVISSSSSDTLANTGQSATYILLASIGLITLGGAYLRKQYR